MDGNALAIEAFNAVNLEERLAAAQERAREAAAELDQVRTLLALKRQVSKIRNGQALAVNDNGKAGVDVYAVGGAIPRRAHAYPSVHNGAWFVQLATNNTRGHRAFAYWTDFVHPSLGGPGLTQAEAVELAERWVVEGDRALHHEQPQRSA